MNASCISGTTSETDTTNNSQEGWKLSGSLRSRLEYWDYFNPGKVPFGKNNEYSFVGNLIRIKALNEKKITDTTLEFAIPSFFFLPHNAVAPYPQAALGIGAFYRLVNKGNFASIFLKQASINFKGILEKNTNVRLGRFEFADGAEYLTKDPTLDWLKLNRISQRLIGNFAYSNVQRSFDGFQIVRDDQYSNITLVGAKPTYGAFDLQGNREVSNVDFLYAAITPKISNMTSDARLFYLLYNDDRSLLKSDNRPLKILRRDTQDIFLNSFGGHYLQKVGPVDLLSWGTLQFGDWGKIRQRSWAYDVELGYKPKKVVMSPWFRIGRTRTSGDSNPNDGKNETFFHMLPWNRFTFFNIMNLKDNFGQIVLHPRDRITLILGFHNVRLAEPNDLWYIDAGAFQNSSFGYFARPSNKKRTLANLLDIYLTYNISKDLDFNFYFTHLIGGSVVHSIYPGRRANYAFWEIIRYF